ncbi:19058_t:CDS:2 [Funneliformis geosporum]|uniref:19058_t:CDS:1 n=1 Tax=Funneliformis geosporum TaxID=1117311 RepID=A0A9W4SM73_9GLOM|nr:19058_t:CDS:2 [Funneliformis geosporum]
MNHNIPPVQIGSYITIYDFSEQSGIFVSPIFATSSHNSWFLRIELSHPDAHCLTDCNCADTCFLSVAVVPNCSPIFSLKDDISQEKRCRISIFFQTDDFERDLVVVSQVIEVSKLQKFGFSFKEICSRKELSSRLCKDTLITKVIFGPEDPEWLHKSKRLGYLYDNESTAPDIIFCVQGKHIYAHSSVLKDVVSLQTNHEFQEILRRGADHCQSCEGQKGYNNVMTNSKQSHERRFLYVDIPILEILTFETILYFLYTGIVCINNVSDILDLCTWANEFGLDELSEIAKSDLKFRLDNHNVFEGLLAVGPHWKDLRDEMVIYIAKKFPLVQATPGFKGAMMNLDRYPGSREIWSEITDTIKKFGNAYYLSVPLI